jgi:hypothetical protein
MREEYIGMREEYIALAVTLASRADYPYDARKLALLATIKGFARSWKTCRA